MKKNQKTSPTAARHNPARRTFIKTTGAASLAALTMGGAKNVFADHHGGKRKFKVGIVGCGGRGTGAGRDAMKAQELLGSDVEVEIHAMGDLFEDRLNGSLNNLKSQQSEGAKVTVNEDTKFVGWDAFEKVIKTDVDYVILATPPAFRPAHLKAAIDAGKNVFMEKPVAVDPTGIRSVIESSKKAESNNLGIVAGTQRRHQDKYLQLMKRIHDGAIGEIVGGQCYWNMGFLWTREPRPEWSDMEWQVRNWLYFTWLSGDHIVEQHVHNIDVINWCFQDVFPDTAYGMGGRQVRTGLVHGNIFDHFAVEFEYPGGVRVASYCRQTGGTTNRVNEEIVGTKGRCNFGRGEIIGENPYRYDGGAPSPYVLEHRDLMKSIIEEKPLNEGERIAMSTLCAISGRMSAYTGNQLKIGWALQRSQLDLVPENPEFGPMEIRPVAVPGVTPLV